MDIQDSELFLHAPRLSGKVVLITGAANGIGKAAAFEFVKNGAKVVIGDIDIVAAQVVVQEIRAYGGDAIAQKCDVASWDDQLSLFQLALSTFGRLDIVVPNAGVPDLSRITSVTTDDKGLPTKPPTRTLEVNLMGPLYSARLACFYFKQSPSDGQAIVFIGSIASITGIPLAPQYTASKHGVLGLARALHAEVGDSIRISVISPWFADTNIIGPPIRLLLAGFPFAPVHRIAGSIIHAASDPDLSTNGGVYTIPDGGNVFFLSSSNLQGGAYGALEARVGRHIGTIARIFRYIATAKDVIRVLGVPLLVLLLFGLLSIIAFTGYGWR